MVVQGSPNPYYYDNGNYYSQTYSGGEVAYQVVPPPVGAVVTTLPAGCVEEAVNGAPVLNCSGVYYQQVQNGYQVTQ